MFLPCGLRIAGTITPDFRNSNNCPRGFLVNSVFGAKKAALVQIARAREYSCLSFVMYQASSRDPLVLCGAVAAMTLLGLAPPERRRRNYAVNGGSAVATHVALRLRESMNVRPQIDMQFEISDSSAICRPFVRAKMHSPVTRRVMTEGSRRAQLAASN